MLIKVVYNVHPLEAATREVAEKLEARLRDYKDIEFVEFDVDKVFRELEKPPAFQKGYEFVDKYLAPERKSKAYFPYKFYLIMRQRPDLVERIASGEISDDLVREYAIRNRHEKMQGMPSGVFHNFYNKPIEDLMEGCVCIELHNTSRQGLIMAEELEVGKSGVIMCLSNDDLLRKSVNAVKHEMEPEEKVEHEGKEIIIISGTKRDPPSVFEYFENYKAPKELMKRPELMKFLLHIEKNHKRIKNRYFVPNLPHLFNLCRSKSGKHTEDYIDITEKILINTYYKYNPECRGR